MTIFEDETQILRYYCGEKVEYNKGFDLLSIFIKVYKKWGILFL